MIFDLHNDIITSGLPKNYVKRVIKNNSANRVIYVFWTTSVKNNTLDIIRQKFKYLRESAKNSFAVEDLHFITERNISEFCALSPIYCGLTWNHDNVLAGGAYGMSGLTELGERMIAALAESKIIIDTAHLNRKSFYEVAEKCESFINSHTCLNEINDHPRNLMPEQVRLILQRGGLIGLTPVADFMDGSGVDAYIKQIDTFTSAYTASRLCIGTDLYGTIALDGLLKYDDYEILRYKLQNLGYDNITLDKIFYKNAEEYIQEKIK